MSAIADWIPTAAPALVASGPPPWTWRPTGPASRYSILRWSQETYNSERRPREGTLPDGTPFAFDRVDVYNAPASWADAP